VSPAAAAALYELVAVVGTHCHFDPDLPADIRAAYIAWFETGGTAEMKS
jgi:hypothetical protein